MATALAADVINNLVFFEGWAACLRSWSITAFLVAGIAIPIARSVGRAHMELYLAKKEADRLGRTDPLTGLFNRRAFYESVERLSGGVIALVIVDIDRFKRINDRHGHVAGDEVLKAVAKIMQAELCGLGTLARVGGEEFALACADHPTSEIRDRLGKLRRLLASTPFLFGGNAMVVTISAGIASQSGGSFDELYAAADEALYVAKASGRDQVVDADDIDAMTREQIRSEPVASRAS